MKVAVVTTLNSRLYDEYADRFFETYNWPFDLYVYSEDELVLEKPRTVLENIWDRVPSAADFVKRNSNRAFKTFHHDAVRFCYKVYAYTDMILRKDIPKYDALIYLDADSVFHKPIDSDWIIQNVYAEHMMTTYMGRGSMYTETGFLLFNLRHGQIKKFAKECKRYYDTDKVYKLKEFHDCEVFDTVRKYFETNFGAESLNIGDNQRGHVQARGVLAPIYDHCKGKRKITGRSPENNKI